jgi:hypothetical protein
VTDGLDITEAWLRALPLPVHRLFLERLLARVRADRRYRFVELCCSVAEGRADARSDLDLGLGVDDAAWPGAVAAVGDMLRELARPVDVLDHAIPEWGTRLHRRFVVQYESGLLVDLVAMPASARRGLPGGSRALYDVDGRLRQPYKVGVDVISPSDVREWAFLGAIALLDANKYLTRGSLWQAVDALGVGRQQALRLWAAANGTSRPAFGLKSLLDAGAVLPAGLDETLPALERNALHRSVVRLAAVLGRAADGAATRTGGLVPPIVAYAEASVRRM